ncbi:MAG: glycoside hydrolase family 20 zincin-like fold domain-containing protein [Planctomycetota bacterium]
MDDPDVFECLESLVPQPRRIERRPGTCALHGSGARLVAPAGHASPALERVAEKLRADAATNPAATALTVEFHLDARLTHGEEGYTLEVASTGARIVARTTVGLDHGARTLAQLLTCNGHDPVPCVALTDWPTFARRGVMLDVSRDRVPRMDRLFELVETLASWKLNELQLYFEHAFAYRDHERVWRGVDPFTPDEIRALDTHCRAHGIELVPNQQSFGHLHHWLKHPEYRHLAEVPEGIVHPFLGAGVTTPEPFSLCPTDPRSLAFLGELYDELLPCFTSDEFNVGLDETIDLGPGRSAAECRAKGVGRVYLECLQKVHGLVSARGKRMQFWADILLHHAELVPEVPKDAVAMLWGYEADHPFERETATLAEAGLPFYVCPGTSSWQSIGGRLDNMLANITSAAHWGAKRGARGLLVTDWGDRGHLQPPCVSWPGFLVAADQAWNPRTEVVDDPREGSRLMRCLSAHVFDELEPRLSLATLTLASAAKAAGSAVRNASPLSVLFTKFDHPFPPAELADLSIDGLERAARHAQGAGMSLRRAQPTSPQARRAYAEIEWTAGTMFCAARLGQWRLETGSSDLAAIPTQRKAMLADMLAPRIAEHRTLWLESSRPGGLDRSARWLERVLAALRS